MASIRRSPPAGCCLPCATTPAEDENGRPAPKRARGKIPEPARARWLQFAPWHYAEEAMLHDEAGRLHNIPAGVKEPSTRYRRATLTWETATSARGTGWWPMVGTGGWRGASSPCSWHSRWRSRRRLRCRPPPGPPRCRGWRAQFGGGPLDMSPPTPPGVPAGPPRG